MSITPDKTIGVIPMCAVCNKEVDSIEKYRDILSKEDRFVVRCHGEAEVFNLTDEQRKRATSIDPGIAFNTKKIEK